MKFEVEKVESFTGHKDCVYNVCGSTDSHKFFSSAGDGLIVEWDSRIPDLGKPLAQMQHSVYALHLEKEDNLLWVGDNFEGIRSFDLISRKETGSLALNKAAIFDIKTYNSNVFIAGGDGVITVVDKENLAFKKHLKSSSKSVRALAINPVERELAAGYSDHTIRIFDLNSFELKKQINAHRNSVFTLAYSPNFESLYSGSRDAHIKNWNIQNNYELSEQVIGHMYTINHISFSPAGKLFATCSMDKSIKIWDSAQMKLLKVLDQTRHAGHGTSVNRLHWLSDESLVSASDDRSLSLWKIGQY